MQPNQYDMIEPSDLQRIHEASLQVLQQTGLFVDHPEARDRLAEAGAKADTKDKRVCIPPEMVEKALQAAPKSFICAGRTSDYDMLVTSSPSQPPVARTVGGPLTLYDYSIGQSRPLSIQDCADLARLTDGLNQVHIMGGLTPQDIPQETYDIETLKVLLEYGRKHIWALTTDSTHLKYQLQMMEAVSGSLEELSRRPLCSGIVCILEPLSFPRDEIERLLLYSRYKLPVKVPLVPIVGASAPYTLAGTMVQTNAEALGSLVLLQTLCPGIPTWYYIIMETMEMRKGSFQMFNPEVMLILNGLFQLARSYKLPASSSSLIGSNTQAHQLMFERGTSLVMSTMSGVSEVGGVGGLGNGMMISPQLMAIDNEMIAFVKRYLQGFEISAETMAVEVIQRVGHSGKFLEDVHTLNHLRREARFKPVLFDWRPFLDQHEDPKTIFQRAQENIAGLREYHEVEPLDPEIQKELHAILAAAQKEFLG